MPLGRTVLVPMVNPEKAPGLVRLAAALAKPVGGTVVALTVVDPGGRPRTLDAGWELVDQAAALARQLGVMARGMVQLDPSVTEGVLGAIADEDASLTVMGWEGVPRRNNAFDALVDTIVGRSPVPLVVARFGAEWPARMLLTVDADDLLPVGLPGVEMAAEVARCLGDSAHAPVHLLLAGAEVDDVPPGVLRIAGGITLDPRRRDHVLRDEVRPDDVVVVGVAPTESGLRNASTRSAWAAPDASLIVVVDVGAHGTH